MRVRGRTREISNFNLGPKILFNKRHLSPKYGENDMLYRRTNQNTKDRTSRDREVVIPLCSKRFRPLMLRQMGAKTKPNKQRTNYVFNHVSKRIKVLLSRRRVGRPFLKFKKKTSSLFKGINRNLIQGLLHVFSY